MFLGYMALGIASCSSLSVPCISSLELASVDFLLSAPCRTIPDIKFWLVGFLSSGSPITLLLSLQHCCFTFTASFSSVRVAVDIAALHFAASRFPESLHLRVVASPWGVALCRSYASPLYPFSPFRFGNHLTSQYTACSLLHEFLYNPLLHHDDHPRSYCYRICPPCRG
jgi:hypothetical protein